jgi:hypothetical protein
VTTLSFLAILCSYKKTLSPREIFVLKQPVTYTVFRNILLLARPEQTAKHMWSMLRCSSCVASNGVRNDEFERTRNEAAVVAY